MGAWHRGLAEKWDRRKTGTDRELGQTMDWDRWKNGKDDWQGKGTDRRPAQDTRIQGSLFASDINMYIGICLSDVAFTRKRYITNTSLVIKKSDLNYEHEVNEHRHLHTHLHLHIPDIPTNIHSSVQTHQTYNPCTPTGK